MPAGLGAMRYGIQGANDAVDTRMRREQAQYGMDRQKTLDQQHDQDRVTAEQDRATANERYNKYEVPKQEAGLRKLQDDEQAQTKMRALHEAYATRDPEAIDMVYNQLVPDGYTSKTRQIGDDLYEVTHPKGKITGTWDELFFGKENGAGVGLFQMVDPGGLLKSVQDRRSANQENQRTIETDTRRHKNSLELANVQAANSRSLAMMNGAEPYEGDDGNMYIFRPDGTTAPVMNNGQPMKAPKYGMGRNGPGSNPFGNSASSQVLWNKVQMARAADQQGVFKGMDDYEVAAAVEEFAAIGKNHDMQMKLASSILQKVISGNRGARLSPSEARERTAELVRAMNGIAGPEPTLTPGGQDSGRNTDDPLGIL